MAKLKPIPTLREKKRYLVFEVISSKKFDIDDIEKEVKQSLMALVGQLGCAKANIKVLKDKFDRERQRGIIRLNHNQFEELKASFTLIKSINNVDVIVKSVGMSGILKKCENKYMKDN